MRANGCTLISRSCTTGWLDWAHGELWVCDDGLLRKSLGLVETVLHLRGGYGVRQGSVHRLITPDEIARSARARGTDGRGGTQSPRPNFAAG